MVPSASALANALQKGGERKQARVSYLRDGSWRDGKGLARAKRDAKMQSRARRLARKGAKFRLALRSPVTLRAPGAPCPLSSRREQRAAGGRRHRACAARGPLVAPWRRGPGAGAGRAGASWRPLPASAAPAQAGPARAALRWGRAVARRASRSASALRALRRGGEP